ncbi:MAG: hypothetical protein LBN93_02780, partial [Candidatus Symbiothrix sp.]|nr:hypothetical protein [Candidatus Symbiothrix sp.]
NTAVATVSTSSSASGTSITINVPAASAGAAAGSATITAKASGDTSKSDAFSVEREAYPCSGVWDGSLCWSGTLTPCYWADRSCKGEPGFELPTESELRAACGKQVPGFTAWRYWYTDHDYGGGVAQAVDMKGCVLIGITQPQYMGVRCVKRY